MDLLAAAQINNNNYFISTRRAPNPNRLMYKNSRKIVLPVYNVCVPFSMLEISIMAWPFEHFCFICAYYYIFLMVEIFRQIGSFQSCLAQIDSYFYFAHIYYCI